MAIIDNRDVCIEIIRYFRVSLAVDTPDDIRTKRRVLLSFALANHGFADIALDELWSSMTTLEPIVSIFNSSTSDGTSTNTMLRYNNNAGYWEIGISGNNHVTGPVHRVLSYLSRIRNLHFATFPRDREYGLWHALSSFGWLGTLCPNLQSLFLGIDVDTPRAAYYIIPLVSPMLRNISLHSSTTEDSGEMAASTVLDILKCRNVEVASISLKGVSSGRIIQRVLGFPSLQSAVIQNASGSRVTSDQVAHFPEMTKLESLDIHLGLFDDPQGAGSWIGKMVSLRSLTLRGTLQTIIQCLTGRDPIPSIHSFVLHLDGTSPSRNRRPPEQLGLLITIISAMLPNLRAFHLETTSYDRATPLSISQILALRDRPMRTLVLRRCLTINSSEDLIDIITVWPTLQKLHIVSRTGHGDAAIVLPYISRHAPLLYDVTLPVELSPLIVAPPLSFDSGMCTCPLQRLCFSYQLDFQLDQLDITKTLTLARNLVTLFPRLSMVTTQSTDYPNALNDVQTAITTFQEILSSPPKRSDRLFH